VACGSEALKGGRGGSKDIVVAAVVVIVGCCFCFCGAMGGVMKAELWGRIRCDRTRVADAVARDLMGEWTSLSFGLHCLTELV